MTYFHRRMPTIIGAGAFHRPVRDGKGWFHSAMVVRQRGGGQGFGSWPRIRIVWGADRLATFGRLNWKKVLGCYCIAHTQLHASQNYRIKPHGQLVLVSLMHYCASTPSLSTSWSRTTLQCDQVTRDILS